MRILIIEDEVRLNDILKRGFTEDGFAVDQAFDGEEGQYLSENEQYDLIILDLNLPKIDGITVCKNLRKEKNKTPIIILTAKSTIENKIEGLDCGADDYITKPFSFTELKSRVHALIRRSHQDPSPILEVSGLILDPLRHIVTRDQKLIKLTPKEFAILELLMRNAGEVTTRTKIIEHVWDYNFDGMSNIIDVLVVTLRKKINNGFSLKLIKTVHGIGYTI